MEMRLPRAIPVIMFCNYLPAFMVGSKLKDMGPVPSQEIGVDWFCSIQDDECMFYREGIILIVYFNDCIFLGQSDDQLTGIIKKLTHIGLEIEDQGNPANYVSVDIKCLSDSFCTFFKKTLIDIIIDEMGLTLSGHTKLVPAKCTQRLNGFLDLPSFNQDWNYRFVLGDLNYLALTSRPDM
ncbi:hypothetical protein ACHAW6_010189 [Cyclotella cf. meneghiniana]